jgi:putative mRNA 3-end processing factor
VYRWPDPERVAAAMNDWWRENAALGRASCIYAYAIGKSQRVLAMLDRSIGPIYTHGAVERGVRAYRDSGVCLPETTPVSATARGHDFAGAMILAVPSAHGTAWTRRFGEVSTAMASGWMMVRGQRRRRSMDRGFVLSDHVDWNSLLAAVEASGCERVWATHGYSRTVARYLTERGLNARSLDTRFGQEEEEPEGGEA